MGRKVTHQLQPLWFNGFKEESFRLSILDIVIPPNYNTYAIVFKSDNADEKIVAETFKQGIDATLLQCRHLVGTVEKNQDGDYSIVTKPDSTVELVFHWLNGTDDDYPSYSELERQNFSSRCLGSAATLGIDGMPTARGPDDSPAMVGFQLNFIRGGFILTIHIHHFAVDMAGTTSLVRQIADNCSSIRYRTPPPSWDEAFMDRSRFIAPKIAFEDQISPIPRPPRHPDWLPCSWLLFHLPPTEAAALKKLASPKDGAWISIYDALTAVLWRVIARNRAQVYKPVLKQPAIFGEPINMRRRCTPQISPRYQGNVLAAGLSRHQKYPLTLADVISDSSLSQIATYIRAITDSVSEKSLDDTVARFAKIRDKSNLDVPLDSLPPMSFTTTDWRNFRLCDNDFGIGQPMAYRNLTDTVVENMIVMYPPHKGNGGKNQGVEVVLPFEKQSVDLLINDPIMKEYFEFRGIEVEDP
ncbi:acyltransferase [Trichoderma asperelloides]|nr:acyltransferase [Trichoderma asperelloides]